MSKFALAAAVIGFGSMAVANTAFAYEAHHHHHMRHYNEMHKHMQMHDRHMSHGTGHDRPTATGGNAGGFSNRN